MHIYTCLLHKTEIKGYVLITNFIQTLKFEFLITQYMVPVEQIALRKLLNIDNWETSDWLNVMILTNQKS